MSDSLAHVLESGSKQYYNNSLSIEDYLMRVMECTDQLMHSGRFDSIDEVLKDLDPALYPSTIVIGLLVATNPPSAKSKLSHRGDFRQRAVKLYVTRDDFDALFSGIV
jgi:hypothetical protein